MIKVSFLYPNTDGSRFDLDYYLNTHLALSRKRLEPALKSLSVDYGIAGVMLGSKPPFHAIGHLMFESLDEFYAALMPHVEELKDDVKNYTDVEAVIQINDMTIG